jgi:hypothetical protein
MAVLLPERLISRRQQLQCQLLLGGASDFARMPENSYAVGRMATQTGQGVGHRAKK